MDENKRKIAFLDLALALIVLALFSMAPQTFPLRTADPGAKNAGNDIATVKDSGMSVMPMNKPITYRVSMDTSSESSQLSDIPIIIPTDSAAGSSTNP